jgi:hypothetical protein
MEGSEIVHIFMIWMVPLRYPGIKRSHDTIETAWMKAKPKISFYWIRGTSLLIHLNKIFKYDSISKNILLNILGHIDRILP